MQGGGGGGGGTIDGCARTEHGRPVGPAVFSIVPCRLITACSTTGPLNVALARSEGVLGLYFVIDLPPHTR